MRWQIAETIFCDQQQCVIFADKQQQIEPMLVELLRYFCLHSDEIVSKEQLIEHVWLGRIVSDNAVSKAITKLRKVFNDDARKPKFIATFPKKGYKFIASVTVLDEPENEMSSSTDIALSPQAIRSKNIANVKLTSFYSIALLCAFVVSFIIYSYLKSSDNDNRRPSILTHAEALTTGAGDEYFPDISPDGKRMTYMQRGDGPLKLIIRDIASQQEVEVSHGDNVGVGPGVFSEDGKWLAYLVATSELCQYYIRPIEGGSLGEPKLIHNCPAGSYGKIVFTHDNNRLVYAETPDGKAPYSLYEINVDSNEKKRLNQPELVLGGNSQFDLHPYENKLLISSPDQQQWEGFYSLDLDKGELALLFKQDAYICCGIWDHSGKRVVLMGEHPAYQLVSYDLQGHDLSIIYSGSRVLKRPSRHRNGIDYLFSAGRANSNVGLLNIRSQTQSLIANSSVDDRLATFAYQSDRIAFISLATGHEEIWLLNEPEDPSTKRKLTGFNDSRHYVDLRWSPDDRYLMALTLNEIHVINSKTGETKALKIPQTEIRAVSFKDESTIAYSIKRDNKWHVQYYQLTSDTVKSPQSKWKYVQFSEHQDDALWLDQEDKLYAGLKQNLVTNEMAKNSDFLYGRAFNLKKRAQNWYRYDYQKNEIQRFSNANIAVTMQQTHRGVFDIKNDQLLFTVMTPDNVDIYVTESAPVSY